MRSLILLLSFSLLAAGQTLTGHWEGSIKTPAGGELRIALDFASATAGTISIPQQGARNMALGNVSQAGPEVKWELPNIPGDPKFTGKFAGDDRVEGTFTQGGASMPCTFDRKGDPAEAAKSTLDGFDKQLTDAMAKFDVPGMAVAIIKGKQVIYAKGFGFRDEEKKLPVTPDTLFAIGSATKAFTTLVMGKLAEEGKIEWDKPLRNYIPWFKMSDASVTERLSVRDTVTHRSGLPRHDLIWYNNEKSTREEVVRKLAHLEMSADLREKWQYNNLMFLTAGYLTEVVTGRSWEESVRSLLFEPLGMKRSNFSVHDSQKDADFAQPFEKRDGKVVRIPFRPLTLTGPAGSINSSVNEMTNWVVLHLNQGKAASGSAIASPATIAEMHKPQMVMGVANPSPMISGGEYGLGWFTDTYRGHRRVYHGGNIDGFTANVALFPQDELGVVVLANLNGTALPSLAAQTAADRILGLSAERWIDKAAAQRAQAEKEVKEGEKKKEATRILGTNPSHKMADYAGIYEHPAYGRLTIAASGDKLEAAFNSITTPLEHWHYDTFAGGKGNDPVFANRKYGFQTDSDGYISAVTLGLEAAVNPIVFTKQPDPKFSDMKFLSRLTGEYSLQGQPLTVSVRGGALIAQLPGQAAWELIPSMSGAYNVKRLRIVSLKFQVPDGDGAATAIEFQQPGVVLTAARKK